MIEKISFILANRILLSSSEVNTDTDELETIKYGIECIINTLIPLTLFIIYFA